MEKEYNIYNAYNYDVWGNSKEGYEVNDVYLRERDIIIKKDIEDKDLKRLVKKVFGLKRNIHLDNIEEEGRDIYNLYFTYLPNLYPIGELRYIKTIKEKELNIDSEIKELVENNKRSSLFGTAVKLCELI